MIDQFFIVALKIINGQALNTSGKTFPVKHYNINMESHARNIR